MSCSVTTGVPAGTEVKLATIREATIPSKGACRVASARFSRASARAIAARSRAVSASWRCTSEAAELSLSRCWRTSVRSACARVSSARSAALSKWSSSRAAITSPRWIRAPSITGKVVILPPTWNARSTVSRALTRPKNLRDSAASGRSTCMSFTGRTTGAGASPPSSCARAGIPETRSATRERPAIRAEDFELKPIIRHAFRLVTGTFRAGSSLLTGRSTDR